MEEEPSAPPGAAATADNSHVTEPGSHLSAVQSPNTAERENSQNSRENKVRPASISTLRPDSPSHPDVRGVIVESQKSGTSSPTPSAHQIPVTPPAPSAGDTPRLPAATAAPSSSEDPGPLPSASGDHSTSHYGGARPKTIRTGGRATGASNLSATAAAAANLSAVSGASMTRPTSEMFVDSDLDDPGSPRTRTASDTKFLKQKYSRKKVRGGGGHPSPEEVAAQSEDVLKNFMYERYNQDLMSPEGRVEPLQSQPMLENMSPQPLTPTADIGRKLAAIADQVDVQYAKDFKYMTKTLHLRKNASKFAYDAFCRVCKQLFSDGVITWGRVVALLQFGYHIAMEVLRQAPGNFLAEIIKYLLWFITREKIKNAAMSIVEWISRQGGWSAALGTATSTLSNNPLIAAATAVAVVTIFGTALYFMWSRPSA